jgi:hypothetical protein
MAPSSSGDCNPQRGTAGNGISSSLLVDSLRCGTVEAWPEKIKLGCDYAARPRSELDATANDLHDARPVN